MSADYLKSPGTTVASLRQSLANSQFREDPRITINTLANQQHVRQGELMKHTSSKDQKDFFGSYEPLANLYNQFRAIIPEDSTMTSEQAIEHLHAIFAPAIITNPDKEPISYFYEGIYHACYELVKSKEPVLRPSEGVVYVIELPATCTDAYNRHLQLELSFTQSDIQITTIPVSTEGEQTFTHLQVTIPRSWNGDDLPKDIQAVDGTLPSLTGGRILPNEYPIYYPIQNPKEYLDILKRQTEYLLFALNPEPNKHTLQAA